MPNPIPTSARKGVQERSGGRCEACGGRGGEIHHRRSRSVRDEHTHCLCNLVLLCQTCHQEVHAEPVTSRWRGLIVNRPVRRPWEVEFEHYQGVRLYPACDGGLSTVEREGEEDGD